MTRSRYRILEPQLPHFFTCTIAAWLPVFTRPETVEIVLDSWRFLQKERSFALHGFVILDNHLHMIAHSPDLGNDIGDFKSFTANQIIKYLKDQNAETILRLLRYFKLMHKKDRDYQLWQEGSHPQAIQSDDMMRQRLEYIHNNPVKRGYVDDPNHWRYSSARNYAGTPGLIDVATIW
jgi:REP element-mobilizing transposase RayT